MLAARICRIVSTVEHDVIYKDLPVIVVYWHSLAQKLLFHLLLRVVSPYQIAVLLGLQ